MRQKRQHLTGQLSREQIIELACPMDALLREIDGRSNFPTEADRKRAWIEHRAEVIRFYQTHEEYNRHGGPLPWPAEKYDG